MNPNDPKPLDPETLTCIREGVEWRRGLTLDDKDIAIAELLADRDWQEAQRREAEESRDFLARLSGSAIVRATALGPGEKVIEFDETIAGHALTGAVERLRARAEQAEREPYERGMLDTRRAYAKVWADATRTEIGALDFTADRLHAELRSRWLERRSLADGTVPAVGQRVVTIREVAEQWGLLHGHDGHVHEITSLLGGHSHLVECGPQQIGVAMLRLAPAGSDVTCPACRGWTVESDRRRIDAQVFRETQFKVAELGRSLADAERECDEARAEIEVLISAARKVTGASSDEEPEDVARHLVALREQLDHADKVAADLWVAEQRVKDVGAERDQAMGEVVRLRARVRVEAEDVERAGLKLALVHAWERTNGHRTSDVDRLADEHALARGRGHGLLAQFVRNNARVSGRPGLDILDEMAAMTLEPTP
jgi:hypothetical protein